MKMLLLSNSTMPGKPYFEWAKPHLSAFLKQISGEVVFIPFAGVTFSYDEYYGIVKEVFYSLNVNMAGLHQSLNMIESIESASAIIIGGGNTFHLLNELYINDLMGVIQRRVRSGVPYIGWSAGSNVVGPTIKTTNDMPIVQPQSFDALNLVPFQVNPHYTELTIPNHGGESRAQRLMEFLQVNQKATVIALPEGALLEIGEKSVNLKGTHSAKIFRFGKEILEVTSTDDLDWLLNL